MISVTFWVAPSPNETTLCVYLATLSDGRSVGRLCSLPCVQHLNLSNDSFYFGIFYGNNKTFLFMRWSNSVSWWMWLILSKEKYWGRKNLVRSHRYGVSVAVILRNKIGYYNMELILRILYLVNTYLFFINSFHFMYFLYFCSYFFVLR